MCKIDQDGKYITVYATAMPVRIVQIYSKHCFSIGEDLEKIRF